MLAKVTSCAVVGLDGALVDVEVDVSNGQPGFTIVGLPDAAIKNSSFAYPFNKFSFIVNRSSCETGVQI